MQASAAGTGSSRLLEGKGSNPLLSTVVLKQMDFDVNIGQCVVSNRNLACLILIRHKILSDG